MINVGMIGYGLSGKYLQAPFFNANSRYKLCSICTKNADPSQDFDGVVAVGDPLQIINDSQLDLISIVSPNATHYEYAKMALEAGKHVLLEKPFTPTASEAVQLFELADSKNLKITAFQNRRWDSDFLTVNDILTSGKLGKLLMYDAHFDRYKTILNPKKWKETPQPGSGILYDLGSHIMDQALSLFGKPTSYWGQKYTQRPGSDIDDAFDIFMDYGSHKVKLSGSLLAKEPAPRYRINGMNGSFIKYGIDPQEDHSKAGQKPNQAGFGVEDEFIYGQLVYEKDGKDFSEKIQSKKGYWMPLFDNLADAIESNKPLIIKPEEIIWQLEIFENIHLV